MAVDDIPLSICLLLVFAYVIAPALWALGLFSILMPKSSSIRKEPVMGIGALALTLLSGLCVAIAALSTGFLSDVMLDRLRTMSVLSYACSLIFVMISGARNESRTCGVIALLLQSIPLLLLVIFLTLGNSL